MRLIQLLGTRMIAKLSGLAVVVSICCVSSVQEVCAQSTNDTGKPRPAPRLTPRLRPRPVSPAQATTTPPPSPQPAQAPQTVPPASRAVPVPRPVPRLVPPRPTAPFRGQAGGAAVQLENGFSPPVLPYLKGVETPAGYVERSRFQGPLLWSGGVVLALTYGVGIGYGASQKFEGGLGGLAVPIFGPWIALGKRSYSCKLQRTTDPTMVNAAVKDFQECWAKEVKVSAILTGLGIGQLIGGVLLTVGLVDQKKSWLRADLAGVSVQFDGSVSPELSGVIASGHF